VNIDFSDDEHIYDKINESLEDLDIGLLINNVGQRAPLRNYLDIPDLSPLIQEILRVNVLSVLKVRNNNSLGRLK